jgi:aryl-alcohol dehydrogenase-like predicted oxidoreductase
MKLVPFGASPLSVSRLGLGCNRFGSVLGLSVAGSVALTREAVQAGINFFDTSDIYGQGDSERAIGRALAGRDDVVICTKVGMRFPLKMRLAMPLKAPLKLLARRSQALAGGVRDSRAKPLPQCFEPDYIPRAFSRSLRRLGVGRVGVLLLHNPPSDVIAKGDAVGALQRVKDAGKATAIGISCETLDDAAAALADSRVNAIQIAIGEDLDRAKSVIAQAESRGVAVILREIMKDRFRPASPRAITRDDVQAILREVLAIKGVSTALVGTTNARHLQEAVEAV